MTERDPIVLGQGPKRCGLYWSGHEVHMIHGLKSGNDREPDRVPATVIAVRPDGRLTLDVDGQPQEFWNHDPEGLAAVARGVDHGIELDRRWRLLRIPTAPGSMLVFYLARPDDHRACPLGPT